MRRLTAAPAIDAEEADSTRAPTAAASDIRRRRTIVLLGLGLGVGRDDATLLLGPGQSFAIFR
eukprot:scaffold316260_cov28-Tisochrysis_lutea.AAC.1